MGSAAGAATSGTLVTMIGTSGAGGAGGGGGGAGVGRKAFATSTAPVAGSDLIANAMLSSTPANASAVMLLTV